MSRYTLKTFCDNKQVERFDRRYPSRLKEILSQDRYHHPDETGPWGEPLGNVNRVEIFNSYMEKLFDGIVIDAVAFLKTLR